MTFARPLISLAALTVALAASDAAAQQRRVPRVLDEQPGAQISSPPLRTTLSQPHYDTMPRPAPLPAETLVPAPAKATPVKTTAAVKRRTGKTVVTGAIKPKRVAAAPTNGRALLNGAALRPASTPIVVERNQGPGPVLPNANPYAPGTFIAHDSGEVMNAPVPQRTVSTAMTVSSARTRLDDPAFAPVGLRLGTANVLPYAEAFVGYDSNPDRRNTAVRGSMFETIAVGVDATSDWTRHELGLSLRGGYTDFRADTHQNRFDLSAALRGRIDISRDTRAEVEAHYLLSPRIPSYATISPLGTMARMPMSQQLGLGVALEQDINRLRLTLRGNVDRFTFEQTPLTSGALAGDAPGNYTALGLRLRGQYELSPALRPFAEAGYEHRIYSAGRSHIYQLRGGFAFEATRLLVGEISGGPFIWTNPTGKTLRGGLIDASLAWTPTELTTVTGRVVSALSETGVAGASAVEQQDLSLQLDHAFRRYLIASARVGVGFDHYVGLNRRDTRFTAGIGAAYKVSRVVQIKGELRHERLKSNVAGNDYTANIAMLGLRLQR